ncbi:MAG: hypothetical protein JJU03_03425 [Idiomarina sp.]|nr:hypothetical protein [Idiomarina sp.]
MNPTSKQHRHPGLWSVPTEAAFATISNFPQQPNAQRPAPTLELCAASEFSDRHQQVAEVTTALKNCANDTDMAGHWVTIIGQPNTISSAELTQLIDHCGVPAHRVRWLRPSDSENRAWAAEQALLLGNSALIIAWLGQCHSRDAQRLQLARRHTQANTLLYSENPEKTPLH